MHIEDSWKCLRQCSHRRMSDTLNRAILVKFDRVHDCMKVVHLE